MERVWIEKDRCWTKDPALIAEQESTKAAQAAANKSVDRVVKKKAKKKAKKKK